MGNVVSDGTEFTCSHCSSPLKLKVSTSPGFGESKPLANTVNSFSPPPGALCQITSSSCSPDTQVASPGQDPIHISGNPALGASCKFSCSTGGALQVKSPGQSPVLHVTTSSQKTSTELPSCANIRSAAMIAAQQLLGKKSITYSQVHRTGPNSYDCSGFVSEVYKMGGASFKKYGIEHPAVTRSTGGGIWALRLNHWPFNEVLFDQAKEGDIIVWLQKEGSRYDHVGIYSGVQDIHGRSQPAVIYASSGHNSLVQGSVEGLTTNLQAKQIHVLTFADCQE